MQNKREVNVEVLVGLFLFIALIVLGIFTIALGGNKLLQPHYDVEVIFGEIGGLQEGEGVYLRGKQIGYVKETILKQEQVDVTLSLDLLIEFHRGYRIEVMSTSMLGGKYIKIDPGKYESPVISMDEPLIGEMPVDVMAEFNTALHSLQTMMGAMGEGQGTLGKLLADDTLYQELVVLTENVNQISSKIAQGEGTMGRLVQDQSLYIQAEDVLAGVQSLLAHVESGEGLIGEFFTEDSDMLLELRQASVEINSAMRQLNSTNGTLGKLMRDPALYDEAAGLMKTARGTVDDLRESSPLRSFGSVVFGAF
jgi:phospholipid/cholesterol/gamma-HCH transport system substrate-binding protein